MRTHQSSTTTRIAWYLMLLLILISLVDQLVRAWSWGHGSWQMGECLINYQAGFVRRGFLGEVLWQCSRWSGIGANHLAIAAGLIAYLGWCGWMWIRCRHRIPALWLCSAVGLGFPAFQDCIVRKDCLGLLALAGCLEWRKRWGDRSCWSWLAIHLLASVSILIHESFVFYAFGLLVLTESARSWQGFAGVVKRSLCLIPSGCVFALAAWRHGSPEIAERINASLIPLWREIDPQAVGIDRAAGAIAGLGWSPEQALGPSWNLLTSGIYQPGVWVGLFAVTFLFALGWVGHVSDDQRQRRDHRTHLAGLMIVQWFCIAPLFILGFDYGRWLFFWVASSMMAYALDVRLPQPLATWFDRRWQRWPQLDQLDRLTRHPWLLLLFGVPVCWNLQEALNAIPILKFWSLFR